MQKQIEEILLERLQNIMDLQMRASSERLALQLILTSLIGSSLHDAGHDRQWITLLRDAALEGVGASDRDDEQLRIANAYVRDFFDAFIPTDGHA